MRTQLVLPMILGVSFFFGACHKSQSPLPAGPAAPSPAIVTVSVDLTGGGVFTQKGQTAQLTAVANLSDGSHVDVTKTATWSIDNNSVATVSATGLITAIAPGKCNVHAASGGVKGEKSVEVQGTPEVVGPAEMIGLTISGNPSFTAAGQTVQMRATADFSDGSHQDVSSDVVWSTSNSSVAVVSNVGLVTARGPGECDILATKTAQVARIRARVGSPRIVGLRVVGNFALAPNGTSQLQAMAQLSDGTENDVSASARWSTSNAAVATISANGLLKGGTPGDCDIIAALADVSSHATVTVRPSAATIVGLTISGLSKMPIGQAAQLKAIARLSDGSELDVTDSTTWTVSNSLVAIVSKAGLLTALNLGSCEVLAVRGDLTARATIQVALLDDED